MTSADPYDLERFVQMQDADDMYVRAAAELREGRKRSHWMWFVFPQIAGLGSSAMSRRYAITSLDEARAYLRHPVLGARLIECVGLLAATDARTADEILGDVDAQKLQSSLTLFGRAAVDPTVFLALLDRYFDGVPDAATDARL